jgi:hypothetical protein
MSPVLVLDRAVRHGWTFVDISRQTGVHHATLRLIAKGRQPEPKAKVAAAIAAFAPLASSEPPERPPGWRAGGRRW